MKEIQIGETLGIFHVDSLAEEKTNDGHKKYNVTCIECGKITCRRMNRKRITKNCTHKGITGEQKVIASWTVKRLHTIFAGMKARCYNEKNKDYKYYGAKGIKICKEWNDDPTKFEKWALENGYQDNLTIDRKNSKEGYTPQNCQFISNEENSRKAGNVNWITINGMKKTGREWAQYIGRSINYVNKSIKSIGLEKTIEKIKEQINEKTI